MSATALTLALLVSPPFTTCLQDPPAVEEQESELDKLLRAARTGRAHIRPQAARRILRMWTRGDEPTRIKVIDRLHTEAGQTTSDLGDLGSALVEVLAEFEDEELRRRLWAGVNDADFPWRPYAARSLALTARESELGQLRSMLGDPIGPVRAAGIQALATLNATGESNPLRERLADEVDFVRRAAADLLVRWGHSDALWYLFEELQRSDRFFDRPTGREARHKTLTSMLTHLGDLGSYDPDRSPAQNRVVIAVLGTKVESLAGKRPDLPAQARAGAPFEGEVLGLEVRSCRRGEYYLRWTKADQLLVGHGNSAVVKLPAGTTNRLRSLAAQETPKVDARSVGTPGCDLELLHWRPEETTEMWIVSKGPEAVDDLRPKALSLLYQELVATLPDTENADPRLDRLRRRVLAALAAVGGPLE